MVYAFAATVGALSALGLWRWSDNRRLARAWNRLKQVSRVRTTEFAPAMVEALPDPARRFFLYTIEPGAPVRAVTELRMVGELGLGTKRRPNYLPMHAEQILAPPHGLVWKLRAGRGPMRIEGSDGLDGTDSWVRFWLLGLVPIVRAGGNRDHARAAFGRVVAEAVFWAPGALLPAPGVHWEAVSSETARATVTANGMTQTVDVTVADDGRPATVVIPRWSNANPERTYRLQPFGGYLSEFRSFAGYRLPTRVEGGNFIGSDDYFPFYKARVEDLRFPAD